MPAVTITLEDTPAGGVSIHTNFKPAIGAPCSPAQSAALEILSRTRKDWGMPVTKRPGSNPLPTFSKPVPPPNPPAVPSQDGSR